MPEPNPRLPGAAVPGSTLRQQHSWFVLKYLLGHENIKNHDGSWTEWGNLVGAPVATGTGTMTAAGR